MRRLVRIITCVLVGALVGEPTMTEPENKSVRLWWYTHGRALSQVCSSEAKAVVEAWVSELESYGSVEGLELADGTFIKRDDWTAYQEAAYDHPSAEVRDYWRDRPRPDAVPETA